MQTYNMSDIKNRLLKIDKLRVFIKADQYGQTNASSINKLDESYYICGLDKLDGYYLLLEMFFDEKDLVLKQERYNQDPFNFYEVKAIYENQKKTKIIFIDVEYIEEYIRNLTSFTTIIDKDKILRGKSSDKLKVDSSIDSQEFKQNGIDFFMNLIEVAVAISRRDIVTSNYTYDKLKKHLLTMASFYIECKYDGKVGIGQNGENLVDNIDKETYEQFQTIFATNTTEKFWNSVFNIAGLYRKLGLEVARNKGLEYPKKEDVDSMNYLRFLYENFGRKNHG